MKHEYVLFPDLQSVAPIIVNLGIMTVVYFAISYSFIHNTFHAGSPQLRFSSSS